MRNVTLEKVETILQMTSQDQNLPQNIPADHHGDDDHGGDDDDKDDDDQSSFYIPQDNHHSSHEGSISVSQTLRRGKKLKKMAKKQQ